MASNNTIDFSKYKSIKDFVTAANDTIYRLEYALYTILETDRVDVIKEIAAEALGEDLEVYLEKDIRKELDFDDPDRLPWDDIYGKEDV